MVDWCVNEYKLKISRDSKVVFKIISAISFYFLGGATIGKVYLPTEKILID